MWSGVTVVHMFGGGEKAAVGIGTGEYNNKLDAKLPGSTSNTDRSSPLGVFKGCGIRI